MKIKFQEQTPEGFLYQYLSIISAISPPGRQLSPLDIQVLTAFALLPTEYEHFRFSPQGRRRVLQYFSTFSPPLSKQHLNNKIYELRDKKYINFVEEDKLYYLIPHITKALQSFLENKTFTLSLVFPSKDESTDTQD